MRKTIDITITAEGRDKGKVYRLTEMPASRVEKFAVRTFLALARGGVEVPTDLEGRGIEGLASLGFQALGGLPFDEASALMDEMMTCIQFVPDPGRRDVVRPLMTDDDIEEVATRAKLRAEVFTLHTGFSIAGAVSKLSSMTPASKDSPNTSTSPQQ